jgi:hypothetical protein
MRQSACSDNGAHVRAIRNGSNLLTLALLCPALRQALIREASDS